MKKDLIIIIPAYNEGKSLGAFLDKLKSEPVYAHSDILVIDDGSKDNTSEIAKEKGVFVVRHIFNMGYSCALQTGYKYALQKDYDYLVQIDGDGQHDSGNVEAIYNVLTDPGLLPDIVIGSRFLSDNNELMPSATKLFAIKFFRFILKSATGKVFTDPTSGLQGMRRSVFENLSKYNNFFHDYPDANNILQLFFNNYKMVEIGAKMYVRSEGVSMHSGLKPVIYMFIMMLSVLVVLLREKMFSKRG